jgi:hypothetical protein
MLRQPNSAYATGYRDEKRFFAFCGYSPVTVCNRHCSISIPAVARLPRLGFHSSDSDGYHFRAKPAPHQLRIPPALEMPVQHAG